MYKYLTLAAIIATISSPALANNSDSKNLDDKAMKKAEEYLEKYDTNKDNIISKEEAKNDKMFKAADTDKNGSVSKKELTAYKKAQFKNGSDIKAGSMKMDNTNTDSENNTKKSSY